MTEGNVPSDGTTTKNECRAAFDAAPSGDDGVGLQREDQSSESREQKPKQRAFCLPGSGRGASPNMCVASAFTVDADSPFLHNPESA